MRLAQGLYENGYITYMRTDSTNLASEAVNGARKAVETRYGKEYLSPSPRSYSKKAKNAAGGARGDPSGWRRHENAK